jgi:hypothetical protein
MEYLLRIDYSDIENAEDFAIAQKICGFDGRVINDTMLFNDIPSTSRAITFSEIPGQWLVILEMKQKVDKDTVIYYDKKGTRVAIDRGEGGYWIGADKVHGLNIETNELSIVYDSDLYYVTEVENKAIDFLKTKGRTAIEILGYIKKVSKKAFEDSRKLADLDK